MKRGMWWRAVMIASTLCTVVEAQIDNTDKTGTKTPVPALPVDLTLEQALIDAADAIDRAERRDADSRAAFDEAYKLVNFIRTADPANVEGGYLRAQLLILGGQPTDAMEPIQEWIKSPGGQNDWKARKLLADLYRQASVFKLAEARYLDAARLNPNDPSIYVGLTSCYLALGQYAKAVQAARDAVIADLSDDPAIRSHLVMALLRGGRIEEARHEADRVVERTRDFVRAAPTNADLLIDMDERIGALMSIIAQQLTVDPEQPDEWVRVAELMLDRAALASRLSYHQALAQIDVGIAAVGGDPPTSLRYARAQLLSLIGQLAEAVTELETILQTDPDHAEARELLLRLETGRDEANTEAP